jgi:ADP-ribosylglycohydrolase
LVIISVNELREKLSIVKRFVVENGDKEVAWENELAIRDMVGAKFQIKATDAVACALLAFSCHWRDPEKAVVCAVAYGGDTDTIGSMTGNLAFALWGYEKVPKRWLEDLENREMVEKLCGELVGLL